MGLFRVLLALSVVMSHTIKWEAPFYRGFGGTTSVEIFFLVSGFYIALILDQKYKSIRLFYVNRALRLYPIYLIVCALVLTVSMFRAGVAENLFNFEPFVLVVATFSNLTLIGTDWLMFFDTSNGGIDFVSGNLSGTRMRDLLWVGPAWSLGVEITFYAIAPNLCKWKTPKIISLTVVLIFLKVIFLQSQFNFAESPFDVRFFPFELPYFLGGIILYRVKRDLVTDFKIPLKILYPALILIFCLFDFSQQFLNLSRPLIMLFLIAVATVVILYGEHSDRDRRFGELSYPIYISHTLVSQIYTFASTGATKRFSILTQNEFSVFLQVLAVVVTAYLLLTLVKPIEKIREKNRSASGA